MAGKLGLPQETPVEISLETLQFSLRDFMGKTAFGDFQLSLGTFKIKDQFPFVYFV